MLDCSLHCDIWAAHYTTDYQILADTGYTSYVFISTIYLQQSHELHWIQCQNREKQQLLTAKSTYLAIMVHYL